MTKNILVVEDNPVSLKLVTEILRKKGHFVKTAEDGLSALNILEEYKPDIIFVDLLIPKIDGEMLCKIILNKPYLESTYIVILSGIATESSIDLEKLGADACIAKGKNLSHHIDSVLEKISNDTLRQEKINTYGYKDIYPRDATVGLLKSKQHLEVIIDNLADGLIEITFQGTIILANPAAETFFKIARCLILGKNFFDLFQDEYRQYIMSLLDKALHGCRQTNESKSIPLNDRFITLKILPVQNTSYPSCIVLLHDITERKQLNDRLTILSKTDQLTGAYNRRAFNEYFSNELNTAKRYGEQFSIILIDVDHFKKHNDSFGHNVGDKILKEIVEVFNTQIREVDFLFRWGGDEFVILLPRVNLEDARVIAERIRSTIEKWAFPTQIDITISLGLSSYQIGDTASTLIDRADVALYRSKKAGRNRISVS